MIWLLLVVINIIWWCFRDCGGSARMSHQEKLEEMSKEKWMDQIQSFHITRADMNRLIMNYLVTGKNEGPYQVSFVPKCSQWSDLSELFWNRICKQFTWFHWSIKRFYLFYICGAQYLSGRMQNSQSREPGFESSLCYSFEVWTFSFSPRSGSG